jgi:hypothetical protein
MMVCKHARGTYEIVQGWKARTTWSADNLSIEHGNAGAAGSVQMLADTLIRVAQL